ncbi:MAG TPA: amino acid dehydrogenase [Legionellales bacterium]|nr:amino acid dehydrogenase [Legionellales bacterium]
MIATSIPDISTTTLATNSPDILDYALSHGFGNLHLKVDKQTGMQAIIAIHNTHRGPALGGCRFIEYANCTAAMLDAMRLARGMSYKAALANLPLGGGKAVIIKPSQEFDRKAYFSCFGRFVHQLNGQYITALDSGTELTDMDVIHQHTPFVASLTRYNGDPAPFTAQGVFVGIKAAIAYKLQRRSLKGLHVAIQGLGHVGLLVARFLHQEGAILTVADIDTLKEKQVADELGATLVATDEIHKVPCEVFSPCALGAVLNDDTLKELQTSIIAGAANNQLAHSYHGQILHDNNILYAPDYVINAGGLIFAASKYLNIPAAEVTQKIEYIGQALTDIFKHSQQQNLPTNLIADNLAQAKLA